MHAKWIPFPSKGYGNKQNYDIHTQVWLISLRVPSLKAIELEKKNKNQQLKINQTNQSNLDVLAILNGSTESYSIVK